MSCAYIRAVLHYIIGSTLIAAAPGHHLTSFLTLRALPSPAQPTRHAAHGGTDATQRRDIALPPQWQCSMTAELIVNGIINESSRANADGRAEARIVMIASRRVLRWVVGYEV
jgi:hypothetical protein